MDRSHWVRCLIVSAFLLTPPVFAEDEPGPARLLADLAPGDFLSFDFPQYIRGFSRVGNRSVFLRNENEDLQALWVTDGTEQGTRSLGVIGTWLETVVQFGSTGGLAFYGVGYEETVIWRTDGTPAGTFPVTSGLTQPGGYGEALGSVSGGFLYFRACSPELGCELWSSDGSAAGTAPVGEIVPGPESGSIPGIREIAAVGGQAFLIADEPGGGTSLWIAGRQGLTRLRETPGASHLTVQLAQGKGRVFFFAQDADSGLEVWASDGTAAGTRPVTSFSPADPFPQEGFLALLSGRAWFAADNGIHGTELWSVGDRPGSQRRSTNFPDPSMSFTDVAKAGQRIVFAAAGPGAARRIWSSRGDVRSTAPLTGCPGGCPAPIGPLTSLASGRLVLYGSNQKGAGFWVTDGTRAGTRLLRRSELHGSAQVAAVGGRALFALGEELLADIWITDGTANGTFFVTHGQRYGFAAGAAGASIVFSGEGYQEEDWPVSEVLWRSDGTPAGSWPLTQAKIPRSSSPRLITPFRDGALVQACPQDYDKFRELWLVTQAGDGTRLFRGDIDYCQVFTPVVLDKAAVFYFVRYGVGEQLWLTDGTPQGTAILVPDSGWPSVPFPFGGEAAFWLHDSELWLTDGTIGGTRKHLDFPARATYLAGRFWFFSDSRLWVSDGTPAGTLPLTPANQTAVYPFLIEAGSLVYFQFDGGIWSSDGTPAGTGPAITAASGAMPPESLSVTQGRLYFTAPRIGDPRGPALPWVSDGTDAGTAPLAEGVHVFPSFTELDGRVFFAAADPLHGDELWSTDGTPEGTSRLLDIAPGLLGSQPRELTVWNGRLWFRARDAEHGMELWTSDGTAEGTRLVQDIAPGASWSTPAHLAPSEGGLYFSADDGEHGRELWVLYPF